jgi:peptidoglycan L-alanyl-D-glutamate endopeptidase CwlK
MASRKIEDLTLRMQLRIKLFEAQLEKEGLHFHRSCTMRTQEEQSALWMRGRYPINTVNAAYETVGLAPITEAENKRPVTWVRVSVHTSGEAVDYYQEVKGRASYDLKVDSDFDNIPDWKEFVRIAEMCGLEAGGSWKNNPDWPHVQWKG